MSTSPERRRIAYFALDVPHKGQASYVHIQEISANLRRLGWTVDLFAPAPRAAGARQHLLAKFAGFARVSLRAIMALPRYDILYGRSHPLAWPVTWMARLFGLVVIQEINGLEGDITLTYPKLAPLRPLIRWLYTSQYRAADHLFPVSRELYEIIRRRIDQHPMTVIPNGANTDLFRPIDRAVDRPFVVFFGGLAIWHGVEMMMDALRRPSWPVGVELVVIGTGPEQKVVERAVAAGLPVRWLGYQPYESIPGLIAGAIAALIPIIDPSSRGTGAQHPLKLYEAMAAGLAVIVTNLPGQSELVRAEQCGLIVPQGDAAALAEAVARLAHNEAEAKAMGGKGCEAVRKSHSWAMRAATISGILRDCMHGRTRAPTH